MRSTLLDSLHRRLAGDEGGSARVVISWTLAGGAATGGILVGILALFGKSTPGLLVLVGPVLFVAGSLLGLLHGLVLALVGRPRTLSRGQALRRGGLGALLALPLLPVTWLASAAITVGSAMRSGFRLDWFLVATVGLAIALALCLWAGREGWTQARRAYGRLRWRHLALLSSVIIAMGGAAALEELGPALPGLGRAPGWHVSLPLAAALTLWFWVPVVYVALYRESRVEAPITPDAGWAGDPIS